MLPPEHDWGTRDPAWTGVRTETVEVRGHPVRALRADGPEDATPLLLIHGLGGSALNWFDVARPLSAHGHVVAVDLPGFGATPLPDGGSARIQANAGFVRALVRALEFERVVLAGNSMGGLLATLVASREPDVVERLILVNPALPGPRRTMVRQPGKVFTRILPAAAPGVGRAYLEVGVRLRSPEQLIEESLATSLGEAGRIRPALRDALIENAAALRQHPWRRQALVAAARSMVTLVASARSLERAVSGITAPTLLLWGDLDRLVSTHVITALSARRPDWALHVFEGVGHAPQIEVPDQFVAVVGDWLTTPVVAAEG